MFRNYKSFKNEENVFQENMEICDDLSVTLSTSVNKMQPLRRRRRQNINKTSSKIYSYLKWNRKQASSAKWRRSRRKNKNRKWKIAVFLGTYFFLLEPCWKIRNCFIFITIMINVFFCVAENVFLKTEIIKIVKQYFNSDTFYPYINARHWTQTNANTHTHSHS